MSDTTPDNDPNEAPAWKLARLLRAYRERRDMTQEAVKAATGISVTALGEYERGKGHVPGRYVIVKLANLYEVSLKERQELLDTREALLAQRHRGARPVAQMALPSVPAPHLLRAAQTRSGLTAGRPSGGEKATITSPLRIGGWVVSVAPIGRGNRVMVATNLRTGETLQLLPTADERLTSREGAYLRPAYSPVRGELAYILRLPGQPNSVWVTSLVGMEGDERLRVAAPGPRRLFTADWPHCDSLTWSNDGALLICEGEQGLVAVERDTLERQVITRGYDAWPAYAPDGRWLVYQHDVGPFGCLRALPCVGNLPIGDSEALARYPVGYAPSWCPAFRPDGTMLAFASGVREQLLETLCVYVVAVDQLAAQTDPLQCAPTAAVSGPGCTDPLWVRADPRAPSAATQAGEEAPADLLVYTHLPPEPALMAASLRPGAPSMWQLGGLRAPGPPLYSPCWIPPRFA